jgi:hypothetical protein
MSFLQYKVVFTQPYLPFYTPTVEATSVGDAIKLFLKLHHNNEINQLIMADQARHYKANIKYNKNFFGKKRANISYSPFDYNVFPNGIIPINNRASQTVGYLQSIPLNNNNTNLTDSPTSFMLPLFPNIVDLNTIQSS